MIWNYKKETILLLKITEPCKTIKVLFTTLNWGDNRTF